VVRVPEGARAGDTAIVNRHVIDDVAGHVDAHGVFVGWWCVTKERGVSRVELEGVESGLDRRWERGARQNSSVEQQTRSGEHVRAWSRSGVCWAVDSVSASFTAC
jgi:hypothetical protein